jgi:hypothetical protein
VTCLCLIVLMAVHHEIERLRTGYRMGKLIVERDRVSVEITRLEARMAELKAPGRLVYLNQRLGLGLGPLPSGVTSVRSASVGGTR